MREILFRGKRVDNGEWIRGDLITTPFIRNTTQQNIIYILDVTKADYDCFEDLIEDNGIFEVNPETVCQYTGLTDKNGRKIFEGDIVKYHFGEDAAPIRFGIYHNCFDSTEAEHCGFYVGWNKGASYRKDLGYWLHMVKAEIVGNVFDGGAERTVQQFHERLSQYEGLGVTPEQIREIDRLYAEKCRETAELKRKIEQMETSRKRQEKTSMEWAAHISGRFCKVE